MSNSIIEIVNKKTIIYKRGLSILSVLEENDIYIGSQCKSGYCGTCRIQIVKGNIIYSIQQPIAALFKINDIFPCCCKPIGNIIIKI